mmetsp:Transcript_20390/g.38187  ORF Transcript_20390/g.38187 Transcript_20390/m.38187 type:complete len:159 (-) Transcript_20390:1758-2234(-)
MGNLRSKPVANIEPDTVSKPRTLNLAMGSYLVPIAECDEATVYSTKPPSDTKVKKKTYYREVETRFAQQQGKYIVKPKQVGGRLMIAKSANHEDRHVYLVKEPINLDAYITTQPPLDIADEDASSLDITRVSQRRAMTTRSISKSVESFGFKRMNSIS